jgi:sugar phosphate permease
MLEYSELAFRLGLYTVMAPLSGAASGLLASAILKLSHFGSTKGWQMIFAIEGVATIVLALVALLIMTDRPETVGRLH